MLLLAFVVHLATELVNSDLRNYLVGFMDFGIKIGIITKIFLYKHIENWRLTDVAFCCAFLVPLHCLWFVVLKLLNKTTRQYMVHTNFFQVDSRIATLAALLQEMAGTEGNTF